MTIEVTGASYDTVNEVAEAIRVMNAQEAVLVSEYEPSRVKFLFAPALAAFLGAMVIFGTMSVTKPAIHKVEKQKYVEHMVFQQDVPPSGQSTPALVKELKKRLAAMAKSERDTILQDLEK